MEEHLTKRVAARRQLTTAIRMFFDRGDAVSVYSLATNSWEIVDALSQRTGSESLSSQTRANIPPGLDLKFDYINSPYRNFFKHADRDPDGTVPPIKEENLESIIILAVEDYIRLFDQSPIEFQVYQLWYLAKYEEKIAANTVSPLLENIRREFPNIQNKSRDKQLFMARESIEAAYQDSNILSDPRTEMPYA